MDFIGYCISDFRTKFYLTLTVNKLCGGDISSSHVLKSKGFYKLS